MVRSVLSILISMVNIAFQLVINDKIAQRYLLADGKTKALFGLIEFSEFFYRNYFFSLVALALFFAYRGYRKHENQSLIILALLFSVMSFFCNFQPLWKLML